VFNNARDRHCSAVDAQQVIQATAVHVSGQAPCTAVHEN